MDACYLELDVLKKPIWPFLGVEDGDYFFPSFCNTLYVQFIIPNSAGADSVHSIKKM